jgi:hypothetical protein
MKIARQKRSVVTLPTRGLSAVPEAEIADHEVRNRTKQRSEECNETDSVFLLLDARGRTTRWLPEDGNI